MAFRKNRSPYLYKKVQIWEEIFKFYKYYFPNKKTPNVKKDAKKIFEATKDNLFNETTQFKKDLKEAEEEVKNVKKEIFKY